MDDNIPSLEDLIKSIQEDDDNIPGLDDLLDEIRSEGAPQSSSALTVVNVSEDDLVEEEIDPQILSILGLEDVFDLTYEEYYRELRTAAAAGRMPGSQMSTESTELITEELKRIRGKTGRFKVKKKKININAVLDRKQPSPPGAIVKADKLIPQPDEALEKSEEKSAIDSENLQDDLMNGIGNILESLITIRTVLQSQGKTDQQEAKEDRNETEKKTKKEREASLEKKKSKSPIIKAITKPVDDFFAAIKRFFTNVLLGSVVLGLFKWLKDPKNKKAIDDFSNFLENNAGLILGGLLAIAAVPIAATLFGLTKAVLGGIGLLGGALGGLGKFILGIPGVAPALGIVAAPLIAAAATAVFAKHGAPAIIDAATKLDLGVAAAEDPLVREAYSQLKTEGRVYETKKGRGGKDVRVEKPTTLMSADEKKAWDEARSKESKARELAVDFSRSNQDLHNLKENLKSLQEEKPKNIRGRGRTRTQADINADIQSVKNQIKAKEKEKSAKKKILYDHLKIDPSKPQAQPQTPLMTGLPPSAAQPGTGPAGNQVGSPTTVVKPTILGRYGDQRVGYIHGGTDLAINEGTPLTAVSDGEIVDYGDLNQSGAKRGEPNGWGNFLVYKDTQGIYHLYGHIQGGFKKSGKVKKGEQIAKVGMTGRTSGPHLHWEAGTAWNGGTLSGKFDPLNRYSSTAPFSLDPSAAVQTQSQQPAQVAQTAPPTPSIPSPTGRSNIIPLPIPVGGGVQQSSSGTAPNQAPVPRFSSEDPNNTTTMVVRAIYNIVG